MSQWSVIASEMKKLLEGDTCRPGKQDLGDRVSLHELLAGVAGSTVDRTTLATTSDAHKYVSLVQTFLTPHRSILYAECSKSTMNQLLRQRSATHGWTPVEEGG